MRPARAVLLLLLPLSMAAGACERLLGVVEARVGDHPVVVTDCFRTSVPAPTPGHKGSDGRMVWEFTPCRDSAIVIRGDDLQVNGRGYGRIAPGAAIKVDHGRVLVDGTAREPAGRS